MIGKTNSETSLEVQWLRLHAPNAGGTGSNPGRGTKIPHAAWCGQKKKKTLKKKEKLFSNIIELNSLALVRIYCKRYIYGRRETTGDALMKVKLV